VATLQKMHRKKWTSKFEYHYKVKKEKKTKVDTVASEKIASTFFKKDGIVVSHLISNLGCKPLSTTELNARQRG
jgi:hypothetical protein